VSGTLMNEARRRTARKFLNMFESQSLILRRMAGCAASERQRRAKD